MEIYLTKQELIREESLFKPHETKYPRLPKKTIDLRLFTPPKNESDSMTQQLPPSC